MSGFEVEFYRMTNGEEPARDFLLSLGCKMRAKMVDTIVLLRDNGNNLREPYSKYLADGSKRPKDTVQTIWNETGEMMGTKFNDFLAEQLKDPEFRREYEALQPEHAVVQALIDARKASGLTQKELSERTGIAQGDISKLENGNANPSIRTLQRLANAMGMVVKVEFFPVTAEKA